LVKRGMVRKAITVLSPKSMGFTLIEIIVVVAIIGILVVAFYPMVLNTLENRDIENAARLIQMTFQQAKFEAIRTRLDHRVRFWQGNDGRWNYTIERLIQAGQWEPVHGFIPRQIPAKFEVTISLPNASTGTGYALIFTPIGTIAKDNYDPNLRSVSLHSRKLSSQGQLGTITIYVYAGGSFQYVRTA